MDMRFSVPAATPDLYKALHGVSAAITRSGLPQRLRHLIDLRVSQINHCAYCIDMHGREALHEGETQERLDALAGWRQSPLFDPDEKAAFAWAEVLTRTEHEAIEPGLVELRRHFSDEQVAALTVAVATINAWNRLGIAQFREQPAAAVA